MHEGGLMDKLTYYKDRYDESHAWYKGVEDKASKSMSLTSIVISSLIILIKLEDVFSPENGVEAISSFVLLFAAISLFYSIFLSLSVFKIADTGTMPTSEDQVLPCFYASEECKQTEITDAYIHAVIINREVVKTKIEYLDLSQRFFKYGLMLLGLYLAIYSLSNLYISLSVLVS